MIDSRVARIERALRHGRTPVARREREWRHPVLLLSGVCPLELWRGGGHRRGGLGRGKWRTVGEDFAPDVGGGVLERRCQRVQCVWVARKMSTIWPWGAVGRGAMAPLLLLVALGALDGPAT
jgi:hypothetical protein